MVMNTSKATTAESSKQTRYLLVVAVVVLAFFFSYQIARGLGGSTSAGTTSSPAYAGSPLAGSASSGAAVGAGGCCGSGGASGGTGAGAAGATGATAAGGCCGGANAPASAQQPKAATVEGGIQKISVDVSKGYYDPTNITLKAGVPTEITFSQGSGCTGVVASADLNFQLDLTSGPQTAKLPALQPGEYSFYCGMQMVYGKIVVE